MTPPMRNSQPSRILAVMPAISGKTIAAKPTSIKRMPTARNHPHLSAMRRRVSCSFASRAACDNAVAMADLSLLAIASANIGEIA